MVNTVQSRKMRKVYSNYLQKTTNMSNGVVEYLDQGQYDQSEYWLDSSTRGDNYPDYRQRIIRGQIATTTLDGTIRDVKWSSGSLVHNYVQKQIGLPYKLKENVYTGRLCHGIEPDDIMSGMPFFADRADNQAKQRFISACRTAQRAMQGSVSVGEIRETIRMIKSPFKSLRERLFGHYRTLEKRRRGIKKRTDKALSQIVSDTWLETAFGVLPLVADIGDAAAALERRLDLQPERERVKGDGEDFATRDEGPYFQVYLGQTVYWRRLVKTGYTVTYRGAVRLAPMASVKRDAQLFGTTWSDLVPAAWELVPWSFLIDYFTNLGDIVDAWSFLKSDIAWVQKTTRTISTSTSGHGSYVSWNPTTYGYGWLVERSFSPGMYSITRKRVQRAKYSGSLVPDFRFELPGAGSRKWLNIAALARTNSSMVSRFWRR